MTGFHDAHCHQPGDADGALIIALEGTPVFDGTLTNEQVKEHHDPEGLRFAIPYLRKDQTVEGPAIKYHPRREGYDSDTVSADIERFGRRLVLIDSLNAVHWPSRSYLDLARTHPDTTFVMCHAGGYDIVEFVKMCRFLRNVWLDFSVTQHEFGWVSGDRSPAYIGDVIDHALSEPRTAPKILFGSDYPLLPQQDAVEHLTKSVTDPDHFLTTNFERLIETARI